MTPAKKAAPPAPVNYGNMNPFQSVPPRVRAWVNFANVVLGLLIIYLTARHVWGVGEAELVFYAGLQPFISVTSLSNISV